MMEQEGYIIDSLELIHLVEGQPDKYMPMEYRPDWIKMLLATYKTRN